MQPISQAYKDLVYSRDYARQFIMRVLIKLIDVNARTSGVYSSASSSFITDFTQLTNEVEKAAPYGTLEDNMLNLGGTKTLMPDNTTDMGERGYLSEVMSDAAGNFTEPLDALIRSYPIQISTVGRTLLFDSNVDSVIKDFDIIYYRTGTEIARSMVRNNMAYTYSDMLGVQQYDKVIIRVYSTTIGYRRVRIVEDIPGVYLNYNDSNIVSLSFTQAIDIFSTELVSGEMDLNIENASKSLDILNPDGLEKFLQRKQVAEVSADMVFPDLTVETVPVCKLFLNDWKSDKGALGISFTFRDALDIVAQDEYIKGTLPATLVNMYDLAEQVLLDAGITDYIIDAALKTIYTTACLPIASHKELIRMIAQASQSVVLPTVSGGIHIKYFSPLIVAYNTITNPCFDTDLTGWTVSLATLDTSAIYTGKQSTKLAVSGLISQTCILMTGHKYLIRSYAYVTTTPSSGIAGIYVNDNLVSVNMVDANLTDGVWTEISAVIDGNGAESSTLTIRNESDVVINIDAMMLVDLTVVYTAGKEPDKDWCAQNIRFFINSASIPRIEDPAAVDTLTYGILFDAPEIKKQSSIKSVETSIYSYTVDTETTEVYKGTRRILGTVTFNVKFTDIAKDCTVTVTSLDDSGNPTATNTATIISSTFYAQAAVLKVTANSDVEVVISGKKVSATASTYKIDSTLDPALVDDAKTLTIDNKLVTYTAVAENITDYAVYWYKRKYLYDFDWRQNPAIELLDTVKVYDDFDRNNNVMLTDRTLDYNDGVISGNSKGVY